MKSLIIIAAAVVFATPALAKISCKEILAQELDDQAVAKHVKAWKKLPKGKKGAVSFPDGRNFTPIEGWSVEVGTPEGCDARWVVRLMPPKKTGEAFGGRF